MQSPTAPVQEGGKKNVRMGNGASLFCVHMCTCATIFGNTIHRVHGYVAFVWLSSPGPAPTDAKDVTFCQLPNTEDMIQRVFELAKVSYQVVVCTATSSRGNMIANCTTLTIVLSPTHSPHAHSLPTQADEVGTPPALSLAHRLKTIILNHQRLHYRAQVWSPINHTLSNTRRMWLQASKTSVSVSTKRPSCSTVTTHTTGQHPN